MKNVKLFGTKEFYKAAILIAIPVMAQSLIQSLVSLIDSFMVAGLGDVKMSGVNISGQILYAFMVIQNAICAAGGIFLTQFSGAKDKKGMQQAVAFKSCITMIFLILYLVVTMIVPRQILSLMVIGNSQAPEILDQGTMYMSLMGFVGLQSIISTVIATSYREIGKVKAPLVITVIATIVNTFLNWLLIYGNLGMPRLEVRGAAYATIVARTVEVLLFIGYAIYDKPEFISFEAFKKLDFDLFKKIFEKGWMVIVSQILWVGSESVASAVYNSRGGADVVSGMSSCFSIMNLILISFAGINTATAVLIGKSLGANRLSEAKEEKRWMLSAAVVFGLTMSLIGFGTKLLVPIVYGNLSIESQNICKGMINMVSILIPLWIYINTQLSVLKAGGDTKACMWVDGVVAVCTVFFLLILAKYTGLGPVAMYIVVKTLDIVKITIGHIQLKRERWVVNLSAVNR